jgi:enoyl-CoA hydratase
MPANGKEKGNYKYLDVTSYDGGKVVRILMNRPEYRNAQSRGLLVELDNAFLAAEADDDVRVVILGGAGGLFSSGHDLGTPDARAERAPGPDQHESFRTNGATRQGAEARMLQEWHYFFTNALRWRNLRKITIAQVQGTVYVGGLILMMCCDLIVASEDAEFVDFGGPRFGICCLEYPATTWDLGPRRTKELLLTGDSINVQDAYRVGMVSKIFPKEELSNRTLEFAERIAAVPSMTSLLIKESVNQTLDQMGFTNSLHSSFYLHQLAHSHWAGIHEDKGAIARPEDGGIDWRNPQRHVRAQKDKVRA